MLSVHHLTDRIDVFTRLSKAKMINAELRKALGALAGMMMAGTTDCCVENMAIGLRAIVPN